MNLIQNFARHGPKSSFPLHILGCEYIEFSKRTIFSSLLKSHDIEAQMLHTSA